ncbi:MAG TPA: isopentenyl phosphate kinase [Thermoplasmata archaeon]|nr:isopentenyl phosphate kinase [Thermoplasmata archaeon]
MPSTAPSAPRPVVLKLGGSLVTRKNEVEKLRPKVIARVAVEIASVRDVPLVLLHGAGSFGHPGARRFGLAEAPNGRESAGARTRGAAIVSTEVRRLHIAILRELVAAGARPLSVPMSTHARNKGGTLASIDASPIEDALERGATPVSFGDVVPDDDWGFSILSADTIAESLVPLLGPSRVVFATDVPGILEKNAGRRRPIVPEVTDELVASLPSRGAGHDVTGGIRGKAAAMRRIARAGVDAVLISGLTDGAVARAIRGESVYGSWARARPG